MRFIMIKGGTTMKNICKIVLLSAGVLLSLTACQKGNENGGANGKIVHFGAVAGTPGTRTAFSGDIANGWERVDWKDGDQLMIWSDNAVNREGRSGKSAVYDIITSSISAQGTESHAKINRAGEDGLLFLTEESAYQFWGIYPADAYTTLPTDGNVSFDIPSIQDPGDMDNAVMLAYASIPSEQHVDLRFNPAYTAFSIQVAAEEAMQITGFRMKSVERKNGTFTFGPSVLNGQVAAKVQDGVWTYTVPEVSSDNTVTSVSFTSPLELTMEEGADKTEPVTFVFFAMPADITALQLEFDTVVGEKAETRKVTISYAKAGTTSDGTAFAKGDPITFKALKKHNIKGIVLPKSVNHDIVLDFQVMPWEDSECTVTYGPDAIVNAVALEFASGAGVTEGGSRRRNNYFANATDPIIAYFSVFTPNGATWKIKVSGDTDKFAVTGLTEGSTASEDGTEITGPVSGRVLFKIDRVGTVTASDQIQLNFYVVTSDGREISINSEITRRNALTITGQVKNQ